MPIKLISIDVDGTLITSGGVLTERTRDALQRAADRGIHVCLNTGRAFTEASRIFEQLPMMRYAVICTGAKVVDLTDGTVLDKQLISDEDHQRLYHLLRDLDGMLQIFSEVDGRIHNRAWDLARADRFCRPSLAQMVRKTHIAEADLDGFMARYRGGASKLHFFFPSRPPKDEALRRLQGLPFFVSESAPLDLEIMPQGVDKGAGLKMLCARLGIDPAEVMAVGDSDNDLAMLQAAGLPVAMGNATDAIRAAAKWITDTNNCDGLAKAVDRLLEEC